IFEADQAGKSKNAGALRCEITKVKPALNFSFRYQAGYRVTIPLRQLGSKNEMLYIGFRVKPDEENAKPTYFLQVTHLGRLPPQALTPKSKFEGVFDGGFFLGPGSYDIDWILQDSLGRSCRTSWRIDHHPKDEGFTEFLGANEIASLRLNRLAGIRDGGDKPYRIAVLLHAAPQYPRKSVLSGFDVSMLMSSLASLLEGTPFAAASITAFSLQKQRELFHADRLDRRSFRELSRSLEQVEQATVDWSTLKNPKGKADLMVQLVNRELASAKPPDAIVIMGPNSWNTGKISAGRLEKSTLSPPVFYLRHDLFPTMFPFRDTGEELTRAAGGKVINIRGPKDLADALRKIEAQLESRAKVPAPSDQ
ncbi:MAG: hypothetical protein ABI823_20980, partial [Bryobacteraceae bacterium]